MTLGTSIRIAAAVPPLALLDHLTVLVGGDSTTVKRFESDYHGTGCRKVCNQLGQGFDAIVDVEYGVDGPIPWEPDKWTLPDEEPPPAAVIEVGLDTAYSYRDRLGRGCEQLHRDLATAAVEWVRERVPTARAWVNLDIYGEWEALP